MPSCSCLRINQVTKKRRIAAKEDWSQHESLALGKYPASPNISSIGHLSDRDVYVGLSWLEMWTLANHVVNTGCYHEGSFGTASGTINNICLQGAAALTVCCEHHQSE